MNAAERLAARECTNTVARETLVEERRRRVEKTDRLRDARMRAQQQGPSLNFKETIMADGQPPASFNCALRYCVSA